MKLRMRNILVLLLGILVFGTIICSNQVNATEVDETYLEDIINMLPDSMNLDIPEVEYKKGEKFILDNIKKILTDNGIESEIVEANNEYILNLKNISINGYNVAVLANTAPAYLGEVAFYTAEIYFEGKNEDSTYGGFGQNKTINLKYNNTDKYNSNDENYVKELKFESPRIYGVNIEEFSGTDSIFFATVEKYYTQLLNDDTITIKVFVGARGGGTLCYTFSETYLGIFRNGKLYNIISMGTEDFIPVVNIPEEVSDTDLNEYIISKIDKCLNNEKFSVTEIKEGAVLYNGININNGYSVYLKYLEYEPDELCIIINRKVSIDTTDSATNIKLEADSEVLSAGTRLVVEKITTGEIYNTVIDTLGDKIDKFALYDITLKSNGVEIQPNGKVKISIPIPEGFNKENLIVYRINEDMTKVKYDVKVETIEGKEYATFETDHFSLYTLAMEKAKEQKNENKGEESTNQNTNKDETTLDETPKTGNIDIIGFVTLVAIISLIAIVMLKKNNE